MAKLLLVEDHTFNQDMLARRLELRDHEVIKANDGHMAIIQAREQLPHVILMDIHLPIMNGLDASRAIKSCSKTRHIPIVAVTAHTFEEFRLRALEVGCDAFETKPIDMQRLMTTINRLLDTQVK